MSDCDELIPAPPVVREKLAASLRQTSLLRRLLRLSIRAAEERQRQPLVLRDRNPEFARVEVEGPIESHEDSGSEREA
jgi:hypothetical protein